MTENPHILTPEAAKEKWCPLSMGNASARYKCQASECMAWRWREVAETQDNGKLWFRLSETQGFCGLIDP